jgi:hypothetical protein
MSLTKFSMQPTLHFRNVLREIKKKMQFESTIPINHYHFLINPTNLLQTVQLTSR